MGDLACFLVSFCNLPFREKHAILKIKFDLGSLNVIEVVPIDIGFPGFLKSATGLALGNGKLFVTYSPWKKTFISILDEDRFSCLHYQELKEVRDGHSIMFHDSKLYIVSTGTDEVICYQIAPNLELIRPEIVWRASRSKRDFHHINSIVQVDGDILISAFGKKDGRSWKTATNGMIFNLTRGQVIKTGIVHPHSLSVHHGMLYFCGSYTGEFASIKDDSPIFTLRGYARGVTWLSDEYVCIAISKRHRDAKLLKFVEQFLFKNSYGKGSKIYIGDIKRKRVVKSIDLSHYAPEIYDLLTIKVC